MDILTNIKQNRKSGLTVSMINIPLSISVAIASGATPTQGLITGIWAGIISSMFASSRYNIFGVAGALTSILMAFALTNGPELLPIISIVSGLIILLVYFLKITKYITLLPSSVLHGFLISVGISIALGQISGALGLTNLVAHKEIYLNLREIIKNISHVNLASIIMFAIGFIFLVFTKKKYPNFPAIITLSIVGIGLGYMSFTGILPKVLLLTDKFPNLQFKLIELPTSIFSGNANYLELFNSVFQISLVVAIIGIIETIISAKIAEKMTKQRFSRNKEVLGLGLANVACGLTGGIPATAVFIRTALNIKSGATSKYSALFVSIFTLIISAIFFNGLFKYLPFPIISAILMNIALGLIDIKLLKKLFQLNKFAFYMTIITALICVFEEATLGIIIGTLISLFIYIKRVVHSDARVSIFRDGQFINKIGLLRYTKDQNSNDVVVLKFVSGLNYLNTDNMQSNVEKINKGQKIIISFSHMGDIDIDGLEIIEEMVESLTSKGCEVYFSGISPKMSTVISKLHVYKELEEKERIIESTPLALNLLVGGLKDTF